MGVVGRGYRQEEGPSNDLHAKGDHDGDTTSLCSVRDGRHEQHKDEGDGVRRYGVELGLK